MGLRVQTFRSPPPPEAFLPALAWEPGTLLLRSQSFETPHARYSILATDPFLVFRNRGSECRLRTSDRAEVLYGNPWSILDTLLARYELLDEWDQPFPIGAAAGFWGYDLRCFVEPRLRTPPHADDEVSDSYVGFYDSLVVFDHRADEAHVVSTGMLPDGSRSDTRAENRLKSWDARFTRSTAQAFSQTTTQHPTVPGEISSSLTRAEFIARVLRIKDYIRQGDVYQVNLAQRLTADVPMAGPWLFDRLSQVSPAPFAAFLQTGDFEIVSSSPELFLRLHDREVQTRPIKGTRPRSPDPTRDAQWTYELQTSPKEMSELVMITDLLRNDLGRICEYGSVQVPELVRLERYPQVQHLVSTVQGTLREGVSHFEALASCFPGGSITGAPKIRAMEIIDELEPVPRGPYTGSVGYVGFNRVSQLNIAIRTALCTPRRVHFHVGAGIVADSDPAAEYDETLAKASGFMAALGRTHPRAAKSGTTVTPQPRPFHPPP
ncbi:MAG: aminodeoxychorismate synthase component I [Verrucomicrobia bacterium]|nr:aminodeoxychorismate synthase component I [Verrucomicrobiota bacterium]